MPDANSHDQIATQICRRLGQAMRARNDFLAEELLLALREHKARVLVGV